jgi:outer membrane immunogenic protein
LGQNLGKSPWKTNEERANASRAGAVEGTIDRVGPRIPRFRISTSPRGISPAGSLSRREVYESMKKSVLLFVLLPLLTVAGFAQESRMDASISVGGWFPPFVSGNAVQQTSTTSPSGLASFRYMLTPHGAVEANYQYTQYANKFVLSFLPNTRIHTRMQEGSAAYVYSFNYKHLNPFLEAGVGGYLFTPLKDASTTDVDAKRSTSIGALYGGGIAYEISPSFDIRVEYRGNIVKAPTFGEDKYKTNKYFWTVSNPVVGIAYHF